jgi:hypothetical protein
MQVVTGFITVGYKDQQPVDPLANEFRGFTGSAAIVYPFLESRPVPLHGQPRH